MIDLLEGPLDPAALLAAVSDPEHGASVLFVGTTRRESGEREVLALEYEAYRELALAEMRLIADEAAARHRAPGLAQLAALAEDFIHIEIESAITSDSPVRADHAAMGAFFRLGHQTSIKGTDPIKKGVCPLFYLLYNFYHL